MRDEMNFDVLAEMGIDVYVLRTAPVDAAEPVVAATPVSSPDNTTATRDARATYATRVVLFSRDDDARAREVEGSGASKNVGDKSVGVRRERRRASAIHRPRSASPGSPSETRRIHDARSADVTS